MIFLSTTLSLNSGHPKTTTSNKPTSIQKYHCNHCIPMFVCQSFVHLNGFILILSVAMFQAERATPTEFRDSHGYDLVGACCALETPVNAVSLGIEAISPSSIPSDIEADISFHSDVSSTFCLLCKSPKWTHSSIDFYILFFFYLLSFFICNFINKTVNIHTTPFAFL